MTTIQDKTPTYEQVRAMRSEADNAERIFDKIGNKLVYAENNLRYLESAVIVANRNNDLRLIDLLAERDAARLERDTIYKHWNDQLEHHDYLWNTYCLALDKYMTAEAEKGVQDFEVPWGGCGERGCDCGI
jgi:hypothetical protein